MSEILWATLIGGAIGVIGSAVASIPSIITSERRWKKEKKLEYLQAERSRQKEQYKYLLSKLPEAIENVGPVPHDYDIISELCIDLPKKIYKEIVSQAEEYYKNKQEGKEVDILDFIFKVSESMRKSIDEIDKQINKFMF